MPAVRQRTGVQSSPVSIRSSCIARSASEWHAQASAGDLTGQNKVRASRNELGYDAPGRCANTGQASSHGTKEVSPWRQKPFLPHAATLFPLPVQLWRSPWWPAAARRRMNTKRIFSRSRHGATTILASRQRRRQGRNALGGLGSGCPLATANYPPATTDTGRLPPDPLLVRPTRGEGQSTNELSLFRRGSGHFRGRRCPRGAPRNWP